MRLVPLLLLLGCQPSAHRIGLEMVDRGRTADAVDYWLGLVESHGEDRRLRKDLERHAELGYAERLAGARALRDGDPEGALAAYDRLDRTVARLARLDLAAFDTGALADERAAVLLEVASHYREIGTGALAKGAFPEAEAALVKARSLAPATGDVDARLVETYRGWAHAELEAHRYRDAATHFGSAHELGGDPDDRAWAAQIHVAYGRDYLRKGACRRAATAFRQAEHAVSDPRLAVDLATALACARTELVVQPFDEVSEAKAAGTALGAMFRDELEAALREQASEHLRLIDPASAAAARMRDPRRLAGDPGRHLFVTGRITQIEVERPEPRPFERPVTGLLRSPCDEDGELDAEGDFWCDAEVPLLVRGEEKGAFVRLGATVRAVSARTGEQLVTTPLQTRVDTDRSHVHAFLRASDRAEVRVGTHPEVTVVAVDPELLAKMEQPEPLPPHTKLVADAIRDAARAAAVSLLAAVDRDEEVREPARLVVDPPITDPSMIRFDAVEEAPPRR